MRVRLFGKIRLEASEGEINLGPPAQRKVFALLARDTGRVVPLDRLIDEMWGEFPPTNAEATIRNYVSRLRKILREASPMPGGGQVIVTETSGYRLALDPEVVDVLRFDRLVTEGQAADDPSQVEEALALWTDEPLADFPYDDAAIALRERLHHRRVDALEVALEARLVAGATINVVEEASALVETHPTRERLWRVLAEGLARLGRHRDALRAIGRYREVLSGVGLVPGGDILWLEDRILQGQTANRGPDPGRLPAYADEFIGRHSELRIVEEALDSHRLVTLVGAAGSGKTRLAVEAAGGGGRAWFVDLGTVVAGEQVPDAVLATFEYSQGKATDPLSAVVDRIGDDPVLVVLDNCEHLLDAAAAAAETILRSCGKSRVMATSREPLRTFGEHLVEVPPMITPESDNPEDILASDAGLLFMERARSVSPEFQLDSNSAPQVASMLRRLDGLPLAIELAAVQVRSRPVDEVAVSLEKILSDHGAGIRTLLPRHRTLGAALEWSYRLLTPDQQRLFRHLGVLTAAFDAEVAETLGGTRPVLADLVDKSLVSRVGNDRYRVLAPVREYAGSLLDAEERDEAERLRDAHFLEVAAELGAGPRRAKEADWQQVFTANREHIVTALDNLFATEPERAASVIAPLLSFWMAIGAYSQGTRMATTALDVTSHPQVERELLWHLAFILIHRGDFDQADRVIEEATRPASGGEPDVMSARILNASGSLLAERGRLREAKKTLSEATELYERLVPDEWFIPMMNLGATYCWLGDLTSARSVIADLGAGLKGGTVPKAMEPYITSLVGISGRMSGDLDNADTALADAADGFSIDRSAFHWSLAMIERAAVRFAMSDMEGAQQLATKAFAGGDSEAEGPVFTWLRGRRLQARIALRSGDVEQARSLLRSAVRVAMDTGTDGGLAELADTAAVLAEAENHPEMARKLLALADRLRSSLGVARDFQEKHEITNLKGRLGEPSYPASREELLELLG